MATGFFFLPTETPIDVSRCCGCCPLLLHPSCLRSTSKSRAILCLSMGSGWVSQLPYLKLHQAVPALPHTFSGRGRGSSLRLPTLGVEPSHPQTGRPSPAQGSSRAPPLCHLPVLSHLRHRRHTFPFLFPYSPSWGGPGPSWRAPMPAHLPSLPPCDL